MRSRLSVASAAVAALLLGVRLASAQQPTIVNTTMTTRTVPASLTQELAASVAATTEATWFAWSVPSSDTGRGPCCWSGSDRDYLRCGCQLEEGRAARTDGTASMAGGVGTATTAASAGAIENDPETEVKVRAVFALSQLPKDESVPLLIGLARANKNPQVRKQAMFWLGQSKDPRALAFFEDVLLK